VFPANTNVLYLGLPRVEAAVREGIQQGGAAMLPGLIFNKKKRVAYRDPVTGEGLLPPGCRGR
jgi:hypothetical protein